MTAYELFRKAYYHYMGNFMSRIWHTSKGNIPEDYISQTFNEALEEYRVDYVYDRGFKLSYPQNPADDNLLKIEGLRQIEMQAGYYLCLHDGHTGDWLFMHHRSRDDAKETYSRFYSRYFRNQQWLWTVKVSK